MFLVEHGVPFDVAFALDDNTRAAMCIVITENNGRVFDWHRMDWKDT